MNALALAILVSHILAAEPAEDPAVRSAVAAERAAAAAEKAADAAQRTADAVTAMAKGAPAAAMVPAAPAADAKPEEPKGATWTGSVALGLSYLAGNSQAMAFNVGAGAERKSDSWILGLKGAASYGQAKAPDASDWSTNSYNASIQARGAFRFTPRYSAYLVAGIDMDHVSSIEERPYGEAGIGILWLDEMEGDLSKLKLNTDVAFRYAREFRFQYYPTKQNQDDVDLGAPRIGLAFRYALNKNVIFTEDAEVLPNVLGESRWLVNSNSKISARVISPLAITLSFLIKYDSLPAAGKVNTDTALAVGIEAGF